MAPTMENGLKHTDSVTDEKFHEKTREINTASAALEAAVAQQKPRLLSPSMLRLYVIMSVGYLVSTMNGFDSSLMGAINAMKPYQETFGLDGAGSTTGIIFIIYQIGQVSFSGIPLHLDAANFLCRIACREVYTIQNDDQLT